MRTFRCIMTIMGMYFLGWFDFVSKKSLRKKIVDDFLICEEKSQVHLSLSIVLIHFSIFQV